MLDEFDLVIAEDVGAALAALEQGGEAVPLAGGTNLLVDMRARRVAPNRLVSLSGIKALRYIEHRGERVVIGAGTTIGDILSHPEMPKWAPPLVGSAKVFAGQMVRNAATVAGNVCSASPAADTVPPLMVMDANLTLTSLSGASPIGTKLPGDGESGRRAVPLDKFYTGLKQTALRPGELVTAISWAPPAERTASLFYKLARRQGDAITVVGVAVSLTNTGGVCGGVRIALGAVAPVALRARQAEVVLDGKLPTAELIELAATKAAEESSPIDDVRASADYRRHGVHVLVRRLLSQAWKQVS